MGSPLTEWGRGKNNEVQHNVRLTHPFAIMEHEVTQAEWSAFAPALDFAWEQAFDAGPFDCVGPRCPAGGISWFDALIFANAVSEKAGLKACYTGVNCTRVDSWNCERADLVGNLYDCDGYRFPTEAEWEYAARAGSTTAFYAGNVTELQVRNDCKVADPVLDSIGWYCVNSGNTTHPVKEKASNAYGLFDMSGNAAEFVADEYEYYEGPATDPLVWPRPDYPVVGRGGSASAWSSFHRSAARDFLIPGRAPTVTLRLVRTLKAGIQLSDLVDMTVGPDPVLDAGTD